ncbi:hypothetical protein LS482_05570 [Sinomicrobium kalidii]|uniref:DUF7793 family protein n=1 Tax=Sinomicrobium kalidii TaxID=2900738 RepID=UPI001E2C9962|nr:hypothetical protein [Sinomicrobium kalidii]UGU17339.1 hypothetical protein LS482_05570 [Sinomicrobium kalidii]
MMYSKDFDRNIPFFENEYAKFWVDQNILFYVYKTDIIVNLEAAKKIVADRIAFQKEKSYPVFCDIRGIKDVNKTARDYLAIEGSTLTKAVSILVDPPISRAILDFYLKMSKPLIPTEVFTERHEAIQFLTPYITL